MRRTLVRDVMTRRVIAVAEDAPFKVVVLAMRLNHVNALPVLGPDGEIRGIVSAADLVLKGIPCLTAGEHLPALPRRRREHRKAAARTAAELMSSPARAIGPGRTVAEAADRMRTLGVAQFPVLSEETGRLTGIVTRSDLLRVFARTDREIQAEITDEILAPLQNDLPRRMQATVDQGVVHLSGFVRDRAAARDLVQSVMQVEGVVQVERHLRYDHTASRSDSGGTA